jgi:hypothetical protein
MNRLWKHGFLCVRKNNAIKINDWRCVIMIQNIFVGIMAVLAIGVGIWAMWLENGSTQEDSKTESETPKKKKDKEK